MTDREAIEAMLTRAGVVFFDHRGACTDGHSSALSLEAHAGPANLGYGGFVTTFYFAADGSLSAIGAWE